MALFQKVPLLKFLGGKAVAFAIGLAVVGFGCLKVLRHSPAVFQKLPDTIVGIRQAACPIKLKGSLQVLGVALSSLAQNVGKVAASQVVAILDGLLISIDCHLNVGLHANTVLKETADGIHQIIIHFQFFEPSVLDTFQYVKNFFFVPTHVFWIGCIIEDKVPVVHRHPDAPSVTQV